MSDIIKQKQQIEKLFARFRYPGLKSSLDNCVSPLFERLEKKEEFIPESVADAEHDITYLELIEDGIELFLKAGNIK